MTHILDILCQLPCDGLLLDSETPVPHIRDALKEFDKICFRAGVSRKVMITGSPKEIEKAVRDVAAVAQDIASPVLSEILDYRVTFEKADIAISAARKMNYKE
jgi:hypothetical protein